jgi:hypothetical protein
LAGRVSIEEVLKHWEVEHALREFAVSVKALIETQASEHPRRCITAP